MLAGTIRQGWAVIKLGSPEERSSFPVKRRKRRVVLWQGVALGFHIELGFPVAAEIERNMRR